MLPFSTNVLEDDHSHAGHCHNHHCCCCARHSVSSNSFVTYLAQADINIFILLKFDLLDTNNFWSKILILWLKEVKMILRELRYLTKRLREKDEDEVITSDWKFAAMVIDRFCLIGLSLYTLLTTVILFVSAPHLIVP